MILLIGKGFLNKLGVIKSMSELLVSSFELEAYDSRDELWDPDERNPATIDYVLDIIMRPKQEHNRIFIQYLEELNTVNATSDIYTHIELTDGEFRTYGGRADNIIIKKLNIEGKFRGRVRKLKHRNELVQLCLDTLPPQDKKILIAYYHFYKILDEKQLFYAKQRLFSRYMMEKKKRVEGQLNNGENE